MRYLSHSTQSMIVHQYHFSVTPGDAVTNHLFFIQKSLREIGIESRLYADQIRGGLSRWISPFNEAELWNCDLLLLHHSHGNPQLSKILGIEVPKALVYHNITPEHFFRHDPHMWNLCRMGRRQLRLIRDKVVAPFAVSEFNAADLKTIGFQDPILFPLIDLSALQEIDRSTSPSKKEHRMRLLFVGKITAHKNQATLIRMLSYLPEHFFLTLVGSADPIYLDYLKLLIKTLDLSTRVEITGKIPNRELYKVYQESDAFVSLSLHEGFGVPLIESMIFGIPLFALDCTSVAETLGGAGVLLKTAVPWEVATVIQSFFDRPQALKRVSQSYGPRLENLTSTQNSTRVQQVCRDLIHHLRVVPECEWKDHSARLAKRLDT